MARKRTPHEVDSAKIEENSQSSEMTTFAKTLNSILAEKGIHQEDMAQALGISTGSISSYRNGKKEPRLSMIVKIADYLGVDCHYLMTGVQAENYVCSNELGLSEKAVNFLYQISHPVGDNLFGAVVNGQVWPSIDIIDKLLSAQRFLGLTSELALFLIKGREEPAQIEEQPTLEELNRFHKWAKSRGLELIPKDDIREMHLQTACDDLKAIFHEILENEKRRSDNGKH